jgi:hypothetical protein
VASVHAVLARFPGTWLLIFDNATDMASVGAFLPPAGPGRVLITSQNPNWPGAVLDVPVLDPDVAVGFLAGRTGDPDRQAARELADLLGGLPLALEGAAVYLQAIGGTVAGYLAWFRQRRAGLLARGEPAGYDKTVASTWALAFDRLQRTGPGAVGLLRLLAFCAPEAVPLELLLQPRPGLAGRLGDQVAPVLASLIEDPLAAGDAIRALRRYSLVTPAGGGSVSVHRLVQTVTADQMPADLARQWRQGAARWSRLPFPQNHGWPGHGRPMPCCCRTPRPLSAMTATGWPGLPLTSVATTVPFGPTMTGLHVAPPDGTCDGSMWPRFKRQRGEGPGQGRGHIKPTHGCR